MNLSPHEPTRTIILGGFLLITTSMIFGYELIRTSPQPVPIGCTQEAMQCPDGSYVGRTGPSCAFAPCPTLEVGQDDGTTDVVDTTGWKTYRNEEYGFEMKYPSDLKTGDGDLNIYKEFSTQGHGVGFSSDFSADANTEFEIYVLSGYEISNFNSGTNSITFMNRKRLESKSLELAVISVSGIPASEVDVSLSGLKINKPYIKNVYFPKDDFIYVFATRTNFEDWTLEQSQRKIDRFYRILSTFKFIE